MPKINQWLTVKNEAASPAAEMLIYDKIGTDWYGDDGIAAKDFNTALAQIPTDRDINVRINSPGGNVWDGMAIHTALSARKSKVTCYVDGVAASIASVIACAGSKTVMPKNALMMIHKAQGVGIGDSDELRSAADKLDVHNKAIASVYATKTGKSEAEILDLLEKGETWMTGADAKAYGLVDETTDEPSATNSANNFDFSKFRSVPEVLRGTTQPTNQLDTTMNKAAIIAMLAEHGIVVASDANEAAILAALAQLGQKAKTAPAADPAPANIVALQASVTAITNQLASERKTRIEAVINTLVSECRITADEAPKAIVRAVADETYLTELQARPQVLPGSAPLNMPAVITNDDSARNALSELQKNVGKEGGGRGLVDTAADRSKRVAAIWSDRRAKIMPVLNAAAVNSVDPGLKRVLILNETVRDFATRMLPIRLFATSFGNVPLQGTNQVAVAYYPLQAAASQNFVDGDGTGGSGYQFGQASTTGSKLITVGTRKYQPLDYSSNDFRRQPWFDAVRLGKINAEKLGVDVATDVMSVFTNANFPYVPQAAGSGFNPNLNIPSAGYTSDAIADLKTVANNLSWPDAGRALIVDSSVDNALSKDPAYKLTLNVGTSEVIQQGKFPNLSGFEYAWMPNFPGAGQNNVGVIAFQSAVLAAFAPIDPADGVRQQLVAYEIAVDEMTGIAFNYRHWGLAQADRDFQVIECAYGYAAGVPKAAQILTHP